MFNKTETPPTTLNHRFASCPRSKASRTDEKIVCMVEYIQFDHGRLF